MQVSWQFPVWLLWETHSLTDYLFQREFRDEVASPCPRFDFLAGRETVWWRPCAQNTPPVSGVVLLRLWGPGILREYGLASWRQSTPISSRWRTDGDGWLPFAPSWSSHQWRESSVRLVSSLSSCKRSLKLAISQSVRIISLPPCFKNQYAIWPDVVCNFQMAY